MSELLIIMGVVINLAIIAVVVFVLILLQRISKNTERQSRLLAEMAKKQGVETHEVQQIMTL